MLVVAAHRQASHLQARGTRTQGVVPHPLCPPLPFRPPVPQQQKDSRKAPGAGCKHTAPPPREPPATPLRHRSLSVQYPQEIADNATQQLDRCRSEYLQNVAPFLKWARYHEDPETRAHGGPGPGFLGCGTRLPPAETGLPGGRVRGEARAAGGGGISFRRSAGGKGGGARLAPSASEAGPRPASAAPGGASRGGWIR